VISGRDPVVANINSHDDVVEMPDLLVGCHFVLTSTNAQKARELSGTSEDVFEILGKPYDIDLLTPRGQRGEPRAADKRPISSKTVKVYVGAVLNRLRMGLGPPMMSSPDLGVSPLMTRRSKPRGARQRVPRAPDVTRVEFSGVLDQLRQHAHHLEIQFRRIADIQADLDDVKRRVKAKRPV
jgi:hypothetical protein